ncbi:8-oxo-dGTP diphosphatase [Anaerotaenia torta]|uniref:NUDIX domain-containing protein n=1 Tax=Anaerotaenia torta TaxID=433293 RepID=UPI003D247121
MKNKLRNMTAVYIIKGDQLLMLYRIGSRVVQPSWCGIGGHFEEGELNDPRACILRELYEETGITEEELQDLTLKYITLRYTKGEIRQNYYFFAELKADKPHLPSCEEGTLMWVGMNQVMNKEMPYTARGVLEHYLSLGRHDRKLYAGAAQKNGVIFHELQEF